MQITFCFTNIGQVDKRILLQLGHKTEGYNISPCVTPLRGLFEFE